MNELPVDRGARLEATSESLCGDVLAGITDAILVADSAGRIAYVNAAAARMSGREPGELVGESMLDLLSVDPESPFRLSCVAAQMNGEPVAVGAYSERLARWLELRGHPRPGG